jgi:hypothetical protein
LALALSRVIFSGAPVNTTVLQATGELAAREERLPIYPAAGHGD